MFDLHDAACLAWVPWSPVHRLEAPPLEPEPDEVLSVKQLAAYLHISPLTLYRHLADQDLGLPYERIGKLYRFSRRAVDACLRQHMP